ncbi:hypothetical protein ACWDBT_14180 [Streptomyces ardesiacus]
MELLLGLDGVVDHFTLSGDEAGWLRNNFAPVAAGSGPRPSRALDDRRHHHQADRHLGRGQVVRGPAGGFGSPW